MKKIKNIFYFGLSIAMFNQTLAMQKDTAVLLKTFNGYNLIKRKITNKKYEIKAINIDPFKRSNYNLRCKIYSKVHSKRKKINWINIIMYHTKINTKINPREKEDI